MIKITLHFWKINLDSSMVQNIKAEIKSSERVYFRYVISTKLCKLKYSQEGLLYTLV